MVDKKWVESWVHLELVEDGGWFFNLLSGKAPWIEVAVTNGGSELNLGIKKNLRAELPQFPNKWAEHGKNSWTVPVADLPALCGWIDAFFSKICSGSPARKVSGWIEGL